MWKIPVFIGYSPDDMRDLGPHIQRTGGSGNGKKSKVGHWRKNFENDTRVELIFFDERIFSKNKHKKNTMLPRNRPLYTIHLKKVMWWPRKIWIQKTVLHLNQEQKKKKKTKTKKIEKKKCGNYIIVAISSGITIRIKSEKCNALVGTPYHNKCELLEGIIGPWVFTEVKN